VVVHIEENDAELAVVRHGRPILSRAFPLPPDGKERGRVLSEELRRSLAGLDSADREAVSDLVVTGRDPLLGTDWAELPTHTAVTLPPGLHGIAGDSAFLPALAMALRRPGRGALRTNLVPVELRPKPFPWPVAVTAALAVVTLLLALAIPGLTALRDERRLQALDRAIERLAPDVRQVEQLAASVERARREDETLRGFEAQHVRALPLMRELTELLPPDVWLTNLSIDRKGIELSGFASAASQLIPLLEGSPALERAEFISPVTKGRDKEQFRLKAGWEKPAAAAASAPPAGGAPARPAPPGQAAPGPPAKKR
jgi:Tfp pilus assembly protein PilN